MTAPTVSVVLPFFRNPLVREAAESILSQTFRDFELIAIDDASGNGVADVLRDIADPRFKLVVREENGGENSTRNLGVSLARGRFIAFQDHDDISYPDRLAKQVEFLGAHPDVIGCGTACHYGEARHLHLAPTDIRHLRWEMMFNNHVMFPTVMVRSEAARSHPFGDMVATDDYRWLFDLLKEGEFVNLPDVLFHYRMQTSSLSNAKADVQMRHLDSMRARFALEVAGIECTAAETELLRWLGTPRQDPWPSISRLHDARHLLEALLEGFSRRHPGPDIAMRISATSRLRFAATVSAHLGPSAWLCWFRLARNLRTGGMDTRLLAKTLLRWRPRRLA